MVPPSSSRTSLKAMQSARLAMKGKGCAGSTASGVSTGNTRSMKKSCSQARSVSERSAGSQTEMPSAASSLRTRCHSSRCALSRARARSWMAASCCAGVRPSGERAVMPARSWPIRPATRTE